LREEHATLKEEAEQLRQQVAAAASSSNAAGAKEAAAIDRWKQASLAQKTRGDSLSKVSDYDDALHAAHGLRPLSARLPQCQGGFE